MVKTARASALGACVVVLAGLGPCSGEDLRVGWAASSNRSLELVYSMRGGQSLGDVTVDEDADRVTVSVRAEGCLPDCGFEDIEVFGCVRVTLDEPLGSRDLVDELTGRQPEPIPPDAPQPQDVPCTPPP